MIARYLIYIQAVVLVFSAVYIYIKIGRSKNVLKISLDPEFCNDNELLKWAAGQGIKGKVSIGSFVYEDVSGKCTESSISDSEGTRVQLLR